MIKRIDITNPEKAFDVLMVQIPAYKAEAALINYKDIPPLKDTLDTLMACEETFYGYYSRGVLCGAISYTIKNNAADIHRLMVHPDFFRKGIARKLLEFLEQYLEEEEKVLVSTASANRPAVNFYVKNGFTKSKETQTPDGLPLVHFSKAL